MSVYRGPSEAQSEADYGLGRGRSIIRRNQDANAAKGMPYLAERMDSETRRDLERRRMPKSLNALLEWYAAAMGDEIPDAMNRSGAERGVVWAEHTKRVVVRQRRDDGAIEIAHAACGVESCRTSHLEPGVGGSLIGSPDDAGEFAALVYGSAWATDEDGSYLRPIHRALDELERSHPFMVKYLFALAGGGYDWIRMADLSGFPGDTAQQRLEVFGDYLTWALRSLWHLVIYRDERRVTTA